MSKKRADVLLFEKGFVDSREKAKILIMEGIVFIGDRRIDKAGEKVEADANIRIKENPITYVSRGGLKLLNYRTKFVWILEHQLGVSLIVC